VNSLVSLVSLVPQVLSFLVHAAAIVLAVSRWQRHPTVSLLVVVASGLDLMLRAFYVVAPRVVPPEDLSLVFAASGLVGVLASGMLLAAVFAERGTGTEPPPPGF
jgi:hypothetical protein